MAQLVKNPPAMRETWVQLLSWEDPLEKGKATHSSIPTPGLYSPWDHKESDTNDRLSLSLQASFHLCEGLRLEHHSGQLPCLLRSSASTSFTSRASLVAQLVRNPPAMQETLVCFLGREDPLEKGEATHSSILRLPWWFR